VNVLVMCACARVSEDIEDHVVSGDIEDHYLSMLCVCSKPHVVVSIFGLSHAQSSKRIGTVHIHTNHTQTHTHTHIHTHMCVSLCACLCE